MSNHGITIVEKQKLVELEHEIGENINGFTKVAKAFLQIRDAKLYKGEYETFEEYCQSKWNIPLSTGNYYLKTGEVLRNLEAHGVEDMPTNQAHAFSLGILSSPSDQAIVWNELNKSEDNITGNKVKNAGYEYNIEHHAPKWIKRAYAEDKITLSKAHKLFTVYKSLPKELQDIADKYGYEFDGVVSDKTLMALNAYFQLKPDAITDELYITGYLTIGNGEQVSLPDIEPSMIEDLIEHTRIMTNIVSKQKRESNKLKLLSTQSTDSIIVNGYQHLYSMNGELDKAQVACVFPDNDYEIEALYKELDNRGYKVAFIVATQNEPVINLDGTKSTVESLWRRITKPKYIFDLLEKMVWKNN